MIWPILYIQNYVMSWVSIHKCDVLWEKCLRKPVEDIIGQEGQVVNTNRLARMKDSTLFVVVEGWPYKHIYLHGTCIVHALHNI